MVAGHVERAEAAALQVAEALGHLMHFWGLRRNLGRIWAYLYLWPEPLTAPDLATRLALSPAAVSIAVTELQKWQVIHRTWFTGDRRPHYVAETSVWKMVSRVLREREAAEIQRLITCLAEAQRELGQARRHGGREATAVARFREERVGALLELAETGRRLLGRVLDGGGVGLEALARLKRPLSRTG